MMKAPYLALGAVGSLFVIEGLAVHQFFRLQLQWRRHEPALGFVHAQQLAAEAGLGLMILRK